MAYSLCFEYNNERHYIHRLFDVDDNNVDSIKTTRNMNYAMLFGVESAAKRFAKSNDIPIEFEAKFIPILIKESVTKVSETKKYYSTLNRGSLVDELPDFLR